MTNDVRFTFSVSVITHAVYNAEMMTLITIFSVI